MKRFLVGCLLVLFVLPLGVKGQYTKSRIIQTADGKIKQLLGEGLFGHCLNAHDMRYTYTDDSGKIQTARMTDDDTITKGRLDQIYVIYYFEYKYPELKDTTIYSEFNIVLDKYLQTVRAPDLGFIPEYLWHVKENGFMPRNQIAKIAAENGLDKHKPGMQYFSGLEHIKKDDKFVYVITGVPEKFDLKSKEFEIMVIDAFTGVVMHYAFGDEGREIERKLRGR